MHEIIKMAGKCFGEWLGSIDGWLEVIDDVIVQCRNEKSQIDQRLARHTNIESASIGLSNREDMDGYRDTLKNRCMVDPKSSENFVEEILKALAWKQDENGRLLHLMGWPNRDSGVVPLDFAALLNSRMEETVGAQMEIHEGMANYLDWIQTVKSKNLSEFALKMKAVSMNFLDKRPTSESRRTLFLHGDYWDREKHNNAPDPFRSICNLLDEDTNIPKLKASLTNAEGVNQFKDKNIMAVLMSDQKIPYAEIPVLRETMTEYMKQRNAQHTSWRVATHHLFRCDQEAWKIEKNQVKITELTDYPFIPGEFTRLLDDPDWVELFTKALASGVIRQMDLVMGGKVWVCGPMDVQLDKLIHLTDSTDNDASQDLLRAFVTFVVDKKDRRRNRTGTLVLPTVEKWMEQKLTTEGKLLNNAVDEFTESNPQMFDPDINVLRDVERISFEQKADAFLATVMKYYLVDKN